MEEGDEDEEVVLEDLAGDHLAGVDEEEGDKIYLLFNCIIMKEKKLVEIQKGLGKHLAAVYQYESPHGMIPIFVLDVVDFRVLYKVKGDFEKEKCIVLSKDDVKNGSDVFPLRFLHMKNHSRLFAGKDVLADIVLEKRDLLRNIELELRTKMIQLREDYLSGSFKDFLKNMESFMSVI